MIPQELKHKHQHPDYVKSDLEQVLDSIFDANSIDERRRVLPVYDVGAASRQKEVDGIWAMVHDKTSIITTMQNQINSKDQTITDMQNEINSLKQQIQSHAEIKNSNPQKDETKPEENKI